MQTAVSNTIMGVSIVFFVLVSLSFLIYLFPVEKELVDDLELIAVITAAIAASEGKDPRQYIVRSIKKVHRNQW